MCFVCVLADCRQSAILLGCWQKNKHIYRRRCATLEIGRTKTRGQRMAFHLVPRNQNWTCGIRDITLIIWMISRDVKAMLFGIAKCPCRIYTFVRTRGIVARLLFYEYKYASRRVEYGQSGPWCEVKGITISATYLHWRRRIAKIRGYTLWYTTVFV